jgi:hypothetical protein
MKIYDIEDEYLFPADEVLLLQHNSGSKELLAAEKHIEQDDQFLAVVGKLIENVCKTDTKHFTVGTHTFSMTAYPVALGGFFVGLDQSKCSHEVQILQFFW